MIRRVAKKSLIRHVDVRVRMLSFLFILPIAAFSADRVILAVISLLTITTISVGGLWKGLWHTAKFFFLLTTVGLVVLSVLVGQQPLAERLLVALLLALRVNILISFGIIYALTTNPNEIPQALLKMRIPHRFGILIMIGFRLYPLILQRMQTIVQSAKARGLGMSFSLTSARFIKNSMLVLPSLLLTTLEVGVRLGETMLARGYDPRHPITISPDIRLKAPDYLFLLGDVCLLVLAVSPAHLV